MKGQVSPVLRQALTWCVLALFLAGTGLPAVSRMTCLMSGRSEVSVGYGRSCCPEEAPAKVPVVKPACCEVITAKPVRTDMTVQALLLAPSLPVRELRFAPVVKGPADHAPATRAARPPPGVGVEELALLGAYRI